MVELNTLKLATGFCGTIIKSDAKAMIGTQFQVLFLPQKKAMKYPWISVKITGNDSNRDIIIEVINQLIKERLAGKFNDYPCFEYIKVTKDPHISRRSQHAGYLRLNPEKELYEFSYYD